jgi:hypothetical protein
MRKLMKKIHQPEKINKKKSFTCSSTIYKKPFDRNLHFSLKRQYMIILFNQHHLFQQFIT